MKDDCSFNVLKFTTDMLLYHGCTELSIKARRHVVRNHIGRL